MRVLVIAFIAASVVAGAAADAQSLRGSRASLSRQERQALTHDFTFVESGARIRRFVAAGILVEVRADSNVDLHDVSYPFARPALRLFIERLSSQFHAACGDKVTVTSLTRPEDEQPPNASEQSVHPTGMAVDLRIPERPKCRGWLERVLLSLEDKKVLEATQERNPPHYHVAVFPDIYEQYVASRQKRSPDYVVRKGDTLFGVARSTGTTVSALRAANRIHGDLIRPGESLRIPSGATEIYRVKAGDSLMGIARLFDTTVATLTALNHLRGDVIFAGQTLLVAAP